MKWDRAMNLTVNGETQEHRGDGTLVSLLGELHADGDRVATMINDTIVRKEKRGTRNLQEGDRVEVLIFAGGG